jgi:hypothetical protein
LKLIAQIHIVPRLKLPGSRSPLHHVYILWLLVKYRDLRYDLTVYDENGMEQPSIVRAHRVSAGSTSLQIGRCAKYSMSVVVIFMKQEFGRTAGNPHFLRADFLWSLSFCHISKANSQYTAWSGAYVLDWLTLVS